MNEFDEMLRDVLSADVCVEPPLGMERRIALALSVAARRRSRTRRIALEAIAAALLIGVAGMTVLRHRTAKVTNSVPHQVASMASFAWPAGEAEIFPSVKFLQRAGDRWRSKPAIRSQRPLRRAAAGIAPIAIASLTVKPVEVASLTLGK